MYLPSCSNGSFYWLFRGHFRGHFLVSHVNLLTCSFVFSDCHTTNILTILKSSFISLLLPIVQSYIRHCHTFSHGLLHSFNSCHHCSTLLCSGLPIATVLLYLHFRMVDGHDSSCSCPLDLNFLQDVLHLLLHTAFLWQWAFALHRVSTGSLSSSMKFCFRIQLSLPLKILAQGVRDFL